MTLGKYERDVLTEVDGAPVLIDNAQIEVRKETDGSLATIYADKDGVTPLSNPFTPGGSTALFYADVAFLYRVEFDNGSLSRLLRYEAVQFNTDLPISQAIQDLIDAKLDDPGGGDPGDVLTKVSGGHEWAPPAGGSSTTLLTPQATTSGTSIPFTGIPSDAKKITVCLQGVSINGSVSILIQLGDAGGYETTGYDSKQCQLVDTDFPSVSSNTSGFELKTANAANNFHGSVTFTLMDASTNLWACQGVCMMGNSPTMAYLSGTKALSQALNSVRLIASNGTATFDAGAANVVYET